ncbi:hypothetical protein PVAP13_6KG242528 [Panicum virgatum]|uniref:Uncharacterized protein n=1 Tax=Panicum virgatum TaxID=38727 RepID=A0A8T0R6S0_PANVG|nr:hypothetical protein PVAP13_6KG242528 [Panicum virgatum]
MAGRICSRNYPLDGNLETSILGHLISGVRHKIKLNSDEIPLSFPSMRASAMLRGAKVALAALLAASLAGSLLPPRHCAHRDLSLFCTVITSTPWLGHEYLGTRRPVHNILTSIDPHGR